MMELFAVILVLLVVFNYLLYKSKQKKRALRERKERLQDRIYDHYHEEE